MQGLNINLLNIDYGRNYQFGKNQIEKKLLTMEKIINLVNCLKPWGAKCHL